MYMYMYMYMLWFKFILGSVFIFLHFFVMIITHYHTQKQFGKLKIDPTITMFQIREGSQVKNPKKLAT